MAPCSAGSANRARTRRASRWSTCWIAATRTRSSSARSSRGAFRSSCCRRRRRGRARGAEVRTMKITSMTLAVGVAVAAAMIAPHPISAQSAAPAMNFDSAANPLTLPDDIYFGEVGGVATNSRGDIFVYTRTGHPTMSMASARPFVHGGSRLFQFDRTGKFTREIGQGVYGFLFAAQVRVDPQDNLWVVDEYSSMVMKFDAQGRVAFLLGRKPESIANPGRAGGAG